MDALALIDSWPADHKAAGVATATEAVAERGDTAERIGWGSVSKLLVPTRR